jgi:hypothetical protein
VRPFRGDGVGDAGGGCCCCFDAVFDFESLGVVPSVFAFGPAATGCELGGVPLLLLNGGRGDGSICSGRGVCVA